MLPNILQGPSLLLHKSFLILGNAARCASIKIPQIASEDDICVLFFHDVLSTVCCQQWAKYKNCKVINTTGCHFEIFPILQALATRLKGTVAPDFLVSFFASIYRSQLERVLHWFKIFSVAPLILYSHF